MRDRLIKEARDNGKISSAVDLLKKNPANFQGLNNLFVDNNIRNLQALIDNPKDPKMKDSPIPPMLLGLIYFRAGKENDAKKYFAMARKRIERQMALPGRKGRPPGMNFQEIFDYLNIDDNERARFRKMMDLLPPPRPEARRPLPKQRK